MTDRCNGRTTVGGSADVPVAGGAMAQHANPSTTTKLATMAAVHHPRFEGSASFPLSRRASAATI
jgi:hypothetical protein